MNQDKNKAKDYQKHISMELTADGARVTNLSLQGSRLILTIEAELADSQLHAVDADNRDAVAAAFTPGTTCRPDEPGTDTEFLNQADSAGAPSLGQAVPADATPGPLAMGSENLPPAPSAAFTPETPKSMVVAPERITAAEDKPAIGLAPAPARPEPAPEPEENAADTQPIPFDRQYHDSVDMDFSSAPPAPPLEPVRELTETWDESIHEMSARSKPIDPDATLPTSGIGFGPIEPQVPPAPPAPKPSTSESAREIKLGDDPVLAPLPAFAPPAPPSPPAAAELRLGNDEGASAGQWGGDNIAPMQFGSEPAPVMETWDHNSLSLENVPSAPDAEPLAMSEESSAVGGARHGEPQPAISFGSEAPMSFAPQPTAPDAPSLTPSPAPLTPEPAPAFDFAPPPAPSPAPSLSPLTPEPAPAFGFAPPQQQVQQQESAIPTDELPTQMAFRPPAPEPAPEAPKPVEQPKAEAPAPLADKSKTEAGGTTVLIRYTCPKCKTQGMQAVDKVGTVVNCSNCGKAMRLVMKK